MSDFNLFKEILFRLLDNQSYYRGLDRYPNTYSTLILDDEYVNDTGMLNDFLLRKLYPEHAECLLWFLWEWQPGYTVKVDGIEYVIDHVDDYIKFKEQTWKK